MTWIDDWRRTIGTEPADRSSRETSIQDLLAALILGRRPPYFETNTPTEHGRRFLVSIWKTAFGEDGVGDVLWFVNEHHLPVPSEWRDDIGVSYCCPDLAAGSNESVLIVELKTERGSYRARQASDYLRVARRRHPDAAIDLVLLGPTAPGAQPPCDDRERYAELTWNDIPPLLEAAFPTMQRADALHTFLVTQHDLVVPHALTSASDPTTQEGPTAPSDRVEAAVHHALAMAPTVAQSSPGDRADRAIDVAFDTDDEARTAQRAVNDALEVAQLRSRVGVWLWRPSSGGVPASPAGRDAGRELRLEPRRR